MARGFASGFGLGVVLSGAALAVLSLAMPLPESTPIAVPGASDAPQSAPDAGPRVDDVTVPAGSEFARGTDDNPVAPAQIQPLQEISPAAPKPALRPADEVAPSLAEPGPARPETPDQSPAAPVISAPEVDVIDLPSAPQMPTPIPVAPPGQVVTPGLDLQPEAGPELAVPYVSKPPRPAAAPALTPALEAPEGAGTDAESVPLQAIAPRPETPAVPELGAPPIAVQTAPQAVPAVQPPVQNASRPAMPLANGARPAPDLSIPSDLGGLRLFDSQNP